MFRIVDTNTRDELGRMAELRCALIAASAISRERHQLLTVLSSETEYPVARFVDGGQIEETATLYRLGPASKS